MSVVVSSLVIPLAVLLLLVNIYFRLKIIKRFQALAKKNIRLEPKYFYNKEARAQYLKQSKHKDELEDFYSTLDKLLRIVLIAFTLILGLFLYQYFNQ